jgi:TolA-binding protein
MKGRSLSMLIGGAMGWMILSPLTPLAASYTIKNGSLIATSEVATMSVQEHYSAAFNAYQNEKWEELVSQATIIVKNFPGSPFVHEALFFLGAGYFNLQDFEKADENLSRYLKKQASCHYFEQAIGLRLSIAEEFRQGTKKHLFGVGSLPRWVPAGDDALAIYEQIIAALPHHELAARALFGKGMVLATRDDHHMAIESFQNLIRRFPTHSLATSSYVEIGRMYLKQAKQEFPNPDFLALAEINLSKFQEHFPGEANIAEAQQIFQEMQEFYAAGLYETAQFFERTKKPKAARLYYTKLVHRYPTTHAASLANERLKQGEMNEPSLQPVVDTTHK